MRAVTVERLQLRPGYEISRVIRGGWQLAGGHGAIDRARAVDDLLAAFDAGITTFDCADIYTGVEELYGAFRTRLLKERGTEALARLRIHTKLVPDLDILPNIQKADVAKIVETSLKRLGMDCLDLVQFHWWDYDQPRWLEAMMWLNELRRSGKLLHVGATNFDTPRTRAMIEAGIPLLSMQTQYSLLDRRPENGLVELCRAHDVTLLCYGSVAGGFLSERWLGQPQPREMENRSLTKYNLIIEEFGGWALFQDLLACLSRIAAGHHSDIASVASRFVLDQPGVGAVIVGARNRAHLEANAKAAALKLTAQDKAAISAILAHSTGPAGDTYTLERDRTGRHGSIMKYNLNAKTA